MIHAVVTSVDEPLPVVKIAAISCLSYQAVAQIARTSAPSFGFVQNGRSVPPRNDEVVSKSAVASVSVRLM